MGKGCKPRPLSVSKSEYDKNYDRIFRQKPVAKKKKP